MKLKNNKKGLRKSTKPRQNYPRSKIREIFIQLTMNNVQLTID